MNLNLKIRLISLGYSLVQFTIYKHKKDEYVHAHLEQMY